MKIEKLETDTQRSQLREFLAGKGLKLFRQRYFIEQPESQSWFAADNNQIIAAFTLRNNKRSFVSGDKKTALMLVKKVHPQEGGILVESIEMMKELQDIYPNAEVNETYLMMTNRKAFKPLPFPNAFELDTWQEISEFSRSRKISTKPIKDWQEKFIYVGVRCESKVVAMATAGHFLPGVGAFVLSNFALPEYRGRGFSKQAISLLVKICLEQYPAVLLYGPLEGHPAYSVYRRVGFEVLTKHYTLVIEKG